MTGDAARSTNARAITLDALRRTRNTSDVTATNSQHPGDKAHRAFPVDELGTNKMRIGSSARVGHHAAGDPPNMTMPDIALMGPYLPYRIGENEYQIAAADPGGEGAPAPALGFGEAESEPDIVDDTPEPGAVDPVPERPAAQIPFRAPDPNEIGLAGPGQSATNE
jgi:hypothetical protein